MCIRDSYHGVTWQAKGHVKHQRGRKFDTTRNWLFFTPTSKELIIRNYTGIGTHDQEWVLGPNWSFLLAGCYCTIGSNGAPLFFLRYHNPHLPLNTQGALDLTQKHLFEINWMCNPMTLGLKRVVVQYRPILDSSEPPTDARETLHRCSKSRLWGYPMPWTTEARQRDNCSGGGRTYLLLALVIKPLTTHPFRDGVQLLLPIGTPPTFGRSLRFFHVSHRNF